MPHRTNRFILWLDKNSFGIYLFHSPLMYIIMNKFSIIAPPAILVPMNLIFGIGGSLIITYFLRAIKCSFVIGEKMIDNKRIAKNTLLLYLRMFLLMGISLYTSRIVLETLGVEDFGVYNIVGSIIVLFSFINNALTAATRRFINFNLGKNNPQESAKAFSASLTIHFIICIILIIISESIGLWFLNTQLNIPENRMYAANWVYQFSILSACIGIVGAPYESTIVAYEKCLFIHISALLKEYLSW